MAIMKVGDNVVLRSGEPGVITKILIDNDMPYLTRYQVRLKRDNSLIGVEGHNVIARVPTFTQVDLADAVAKFIDLAEVQYLKRFYYVEDWLGKTGERKEDGLAPGFVSRSMVFTPSSPTNPADAIRQFIDGPGDVVCECHSMVMAVLYRSILDVIGSYWFNKCFPNPAVMKGESFRENFRQLRLTKVLTKFTQLDYEDDSNVEKGDWVYILNRSDYKEMHPRGAATGWNLVCISTGNARSYIGFGLVGSRSLLFNKFKGKTLKEIVKILEDSYKAKPTKYDREVLDSDKGDYFASEARKAVEKAYGKSDSPRLHPNCPGFRLDAGKLRSLLMQAWASERGVLAHLL